MRASEKRESGDASWRWTIVAVTAVPIALVWLVQCKSDTETTPDAGPVPPAMLHGPPNEAAGQMCVVCHSCGTDGTSILPAPIIDNGSHGPCVFCHKPDGTIDFPGEAACEWQMDCTVDPPQVNCVECHTVAWVNDLCEECHVAQ